MRILNRHKPNDVLFLMPVRLADEKLPRGKVRMLYCDAAGKVYAQIMNRSVYDLALINADKMERSRKYFATIGLEISPGNFIPTVVEIGSKEAWALEHILEHAIKKGSLPDILKSYLKPVIKLCEASREAVLSEYRKRKPRAYSVATPRVLNRLPYYSERDIEISLPIYKAEHHYPLIVLKHLSSNENAPKSPQRLLILDSDGDLAIIKVPAKLTEKIDRKLILPNIKNNRNVCAIISQRPKGMAIDYMPISQPQKKALDTITRYFEESGNGKQPISAAARTVLIRARGKVSPPVQ